MVRSHLRLILPEAPSSPIGALTFEPSARRFTIQARELPLTTMEYDILAVLVDAVGQVVSRDALMTSAFGRDASPSDRALDVHISNLRRKLGPHRGLILTVRSVGYMFRTAPLKNS